MSTVVASKSLQIVIFNHLMLVDANCNDSVTIPRCPNLVLENECGTGALGTEKEISCVSGHFGHPPISNPGSTPDMNYCN
jgi:hypothetical protein